MRLEIINECTVFQEGGDEIQSRVVRAVVTLENAEEGEHARVLVMGPDKCLPAQTLWGVVRGGVTSKERTLTSNSSSGLKEPL